MDAKLIMTIEEMANHDKWLETRKQGIGGSDAAVIVGANPYRGLYALWAEKTGRSTPKDLSDNESVYWGHIHEETVAKEFEVRTGKKVRRMGMVQHKDYPWLIADFDRVVVGENAGLECKTTDSWFASEWEGDNIPNHYYVQCLHYMLVGGFDTYYIACLIGGNKYVWKTIKREDVQDDLDTLFKEEKKFWEYNIVGDHPPPIDGSKACTDVINDRFHQTSEQIMLLTSDEEKLCAEIKEAEGNIKALEKEIDEKKNKLRDILGECGEASTDTWKVTYKFQNGSKVFDKTTFVAENPDVDIDKYYTQSVNRVFRILKRKQKK